MSYNHPLLQPALTLLRSGRTAEAVAEVTRLSLAGVAPAARVLGEMKWGGTAGSDPVAARRLFERAANLGDPLAGHWVTNLMASGIAGPRDWPGALRRLRAEAASDPARASALKLIAAMDLDAEGDPLALPEAEVASEAPRVVFFRQLFSPAECKFVLQSAEALYQPSMVYNAQRQLVRDPIRTSDSAVLHWLVEDPALHALLRRVAKATGTDVTWGEACQVLRYQPGQEYKPHFDFVRAAENQRSVTALVWLNDQFQGGETHFLRTGAKLRGEPGDCLAFWNALDDGSVDPLTEHAGLPVKRGTKLLFNRWIRTARWQP